MEFETVAEGLRFPEGPVVMSDGSVIVVEIESKKITRCPSMNDQSKSTSAM